MNTITFDVPAMYGDHHVVEVRRLLLELSGVKDVYASSSFRVVEVSFEPEQVGEDEIRNKLQAAGYLDPIDFPIESGEAAYLQGNGSSYFRHTAVYENIRQVVGFAQKLPYSGRALWPCPGIGVVAMEE